ncbi:MAG: peptide deformylase [Elusimicrobia bacterium]|nr:peptide deformylase [Elusimicrobiota bacterium]
MIYKVARLGHPIVRARCSALPPAELGGADFARFIDDMTDTMREYSGVGLAANQVHAGRRIAVIEVRIETSRSREVDEVPLTVLVNPEIVERSDELVDGWEGCLSVPGLRGLVPRHRSLRVRALGRRGEALDIRAEGYLARIIQHECDHLDGKVYLDRMPELSSLSFTEEFERHATR